MEFIMNRNSLNRRKLSKILILGAAADGASISRSTGLTRAAATKLTLLVSLTILMCTTAGCTRRLSNFTIAVIPDWQKLTFLGKDGAQRMKDITQWLVDHKQELNIVFVASLGDMTQGTYNSADYSSNQWKRNTDALGILRANGIPFSPCQGNHDPYVAINQYFPVSDFENQPYWGGSMNGSIENAYYLFEAGNMKFILLTTQWEKSSRVNDWANAVFNQYSSRRAIFVNHGGLCQVNHNTYLVDSIIKQHDNIFLGVMGHLCETEGEMYWTTTSPSGSPQHLIMTDYQCRGTNDKPAAMFRYYTFKPDEDRVYAYTYNIRTQSCETDASSQFSFYYDMDPGTDGNFTSTTATSAFLKKAALR
jgi:hypothetical protein